MKYLIDLVVVFIMSVIFFLYTKAIAKEASEESKRKKGKSKK